MARAVRADNDGLSLDGQSPLRHLRKLEVAYVHATGIPPLEKRVVGDSLRELIEALWRRRDDTGGRAVQDLSFHGDLFDAGLTPIEWYVERVGRLEVLQRDVPQHKGLEPWTSDPWTE